MIELKNLTAGYGGENVLKGIDLCFPQGELTAVVGPNGCGKTTLLRSLVGLVPRVEGEILVDGRNVKELTCAALAKKLAYLPQNRRVPDMTVGQLVLHGRFPHLSYPRRYRREDREAAEKAMERMGIAHLESESLTRLSGGTQQKCCIAMALAQESPTIVMDEPLSFLDISQQLRLMELLRELTRQGTAVVAVLHDLALALEYADRLALMEAGTLRQVGTAEELCSGGMLEEVFDVKVHTLPTPEGTRRYFGRRG